MALGSAGENEILGAISNNQIRQEDIPSLMSLIKEQRDEGGYARSYAGSIASGTAMPDTPENQAGALRFMRDTGVISGLQEQSPEAQQELSMLFAAGGIMPKEVSSLLATMTRSTNPKQTAYALDTLSMMRAKNPDMFAAVVDKESLELEGVWAISKKYSPAGDGASAIEMLRNYRDPAQAAFRAQFKEEAKKQLGEISDADVVDMFDTAWFSNPSAPMSPQARGTLRTDFNKLYETYYPMFQDEEQTKEFVTQQMQHNWGVDSTTGRNNLMYLGPTSAVSGYAPFEGSYDWLREDLLSAMGWDDTVQFELLTDAQTEADIAARQPASYTVVKQGDDGLMRMELDDNGAPKRFQFSVSPELMQSQRARRRIIDLKAKRDLTIRQVEKDAINDQIKEIESEFAQ